LRKSFAIENLMTKDTNCQDNHPSRRAFLSAALAVPLVGLPLRIKRSAMSRAVLSPTIPVPDITIASPNGQLQFNLLSREHGGLSYRITSKNTPVIETSPIGIVVDGVNLGKDVEIGKAVPYLLNEKYPSRGVHSEAVNHCNGTSIPLTHTPSQTGYGVQVRAFNDGIAFRLLVFGGDQPRIPDEATSFKIPAGSFVWYHDFEGHYEGIHAKKEISEVKDGEWVAPPLTIKLPNGAGYAAITEAALMNYAGMGLQADGQRGFKAVLGHALPVSHPFDLRYGKEEAKRLAQPAAIEGLITTPWRIIMVGADLNTLVNCDVINNVSPRPDRRLFPADLNTAWLRPGRAVWKYLDGGESTLEGMKEFSRLAGELGFEHNVVEGFWHKWTEDQMRELVQYSNGYKVGIWFWEHSKNLRSPETREKFFSLLHQLGVVGAKIDFFDHEAKEIIDLYQTLLKEAAEHKIMLEFHGANKPCGESRTWPNEMTREAIRGMEYRSIQTRSVHNTTLPFTRFLAGHADYTPMHFGERRRETSWAHQIASAVIFTSPVLIYAAHPQNILDNPAVELIKTIPSIWDETVVLPVSEIGEIAAFARRRGRTWFLAIMNGPTARNIKLPLSFLGQSKYQAMLVRDQQADAGSVKIENSTMSGKELLTIEMRDGGGFVASFSMSAESK
jgi:alpha-glucosidase